MTYEIEAQHIPVGPARSGRVRQETRAVVMHWTASPRATAQNIRDYFARSAKAVSAHYAVDWDGAIIEIMPSDEVAYHCGSSQAAPQMRDIKPYTARGREIMRGYLSPNYTTVGIELCTRDMSGMLDDTTLSAGAYVCARMLQKYGLGIDAVTTHYEVVGWKDCPRMFVNKERPWTEIIAHSAYFARFVQQVEACLQ